MNGLLRELLAAHRIARHPEVAAALAPLRLPAEGVPLWGLQSVTVEDSHYVPDPSGRPAIIVPVADDGRIVDLAATGLASRRSATRTGLGAILGQAALDRALVTGCRCISSAIPSNGCSIAAPARWCSTGARRPSS